MALVNVAVDLVRKGRKVLAVDFDLEAPGLDTFEFTRSSNRTPGLVELIDEYRHTGQAPDPSNHMYEVAGFSENCGELWVVPSGAPSEHYPSQLAEIDWKSLYENHNGFLLMEYLRDQWKKVLNPDYVLIDSRTGHTDACGICTRQFPDSVVILFFPNDQNLRGLRRVVRDIRGEAREPRKKIIDLHFVMSNVPNLDDEKGIIQDKIKSFKKELEFDRNPLVIHHYDSLSLLNQAIFTRDRPKSQLAKEYQDLCLAITLLNPADRDGALEYIKNVDPRPQRKAEKQLTQRLRVIRERQEKDTEVLFEMGKLYERRGQIFRAHELYDLAILRGYETPELFIRRGSILRNFLDDVDGSSEDALKALNSEHASVGEVGQALRLLTPPQLKSIAECMAIRRMSGFERTLIANEFLGTRPEAEVAWTILKSPWMHTQEDQGDIDTGEREGYNNQVVLSSIATGRFLTAIELIESEGQDIHEMSVANAFNYGMAFWGMSGEIDSKPFFRVIELRDSGFIRDDNPNHLQCLAVAYWATNELDEARRLASLALETMMNKSIDGVRNRVFSCWRYLHVSVGEFAKDIEELLSLVSGKTSSIPRFISDSDQHQPRDL